MYRHYFFFVLFVLVSANRLEGQGIGQELVTPVNNPFAETVRPLFQYASGQLTLKVTNGFHHTVLLTQIELKQAGSESNHLMKTAIDISPAETKYIDLDSTLIDLTQKIRLVLHLSPEPPKQKSEFMFRFENTTSQIVEVEPEAGP